MKIEIEASSEEIAALVIAVQERRGCGSDATKIYTNNTVVSDTKEQTRFWAEHNLEDKTITLANHVGKVTLSADEAKQAAQIINHLLVESDGHDVVDYFISGDVF